MFINITRINTDKIWARLLAVLFTVLLAGQSQANQSISVEQNCAKLIELDEQITEVFVANPEIADIQVSGNKAVNVFGKSPGNTTLFITNTDNKVVAKIDLRVTHNLSQLNQTTKKNFPDENIKFDSTPSGIIVSGNATTPAIAKNIENIASDYVGPKQKLRNMMSVAGSTQVLLKVKVAEVKRTVLNKLDINWAAIVNSPGNFSYGLLTGRDTFLNGAFTRSSATPSPGTIGGRFNDGTSQFTTLIDALDSEGLGTILAEPNLIASSGETASFLVGGEFPYPVPQDQNITIEFKKFGISLSFTPTVLSSDRIFLKVRPEVSELDQANSLSFLVGNNQVVKLPGIKTSVVETSVEIGSGQSLAIAGLISTSLINTYSDLPGIADIPILGTLFRSSQFQRNQTELVVIVTPHIVTPSSNPNELKLPSDKLRFASALEQLLFKRLNRDKVNYESANNQEMVHLYGAAGFNVE